MSKPSHPLIYYIRHGETDWNAEKRFQGRREIPLNKTGHAQAQRNGHALKAVVGSADDFDFVCSPMLRARNTMEIIRAELGLDPKSYTVDERLIEMSYGDLEGMTIFELKAQNRELHLSRKANRWQFRPPGGESLAMTYDRVTPFLRNISKPSVIVAHGAVGRGVRKHFLSLSEEEAAWFEFPQDQVFRFENHKEVLI